MASCFMQGAFPLFCVAHEERRRSRRCCCAVGVAERCGCLLWFTAPASDPTPDALKFSLACQTPTYRPAPLLIAMRMRHKTQHPRAFASDPRRMQTATTRHPDGANALPPPHRRESLTTTLIDRVAACRYHQYHYLCIPSRQHENRGALLQQIRLATTGGHGAANCTSFVCLAGGQNGRRSVLDGLKHM